MARTTLTPPLIVKTSTYTTTRNDVHVLANGTFTINLHESSTAPGQTLLIKNINTGTITVTGNGAELIDANNTYGLTGGQSLGIICNGSRWFTTTGFIDINPRNVTATGNLSVQSTALTVNSSVVTTNNAVKLSGAGSRLVLPVGTNLYAT